MEGLETAQTVIADCSQGDCGAERLQMQICQKGTLAHQSSCHCYAAGVASQAVTNAAEISFSNVSLEELYV